MAEKAAQIWSNAKVAALVFFATCTVFLTAAIYMLATGMVIYDGNRVKQYAIVMTEEQAARMLENVGRE